MSHYEALGVTFGGPDRVSSEELGTDQKADLWILMSSIFPSQVLIAFADIGVTVRAMRHLTAPDDQKLSLASRRFLRDYLAHQSQSELREWTAMIRGEIALGTDDVDIAAFDSQLGQLLDEVGLDVSVDGFESGRPKFLVHLMAALLSPDDKLTAAAE